MSLPPNYTLSLYSGDDRDFIVRWKDDTGTAIDLTGYTALLELRLQPCDDVALSLVGAIATPATGEIIFSFTGAATEALIVDCATTCYKYDVQLTAASTAVTSILKGVVRVTKDITE